MFGASLCTVAPIFTVTFMSLFIFWLPEEQLSTRLELCMALFLTLVGRIWVFLLLFSMPPTCMGIPQHEPLRMAPLQLSSSSPVIPMWHATTTWIPFNA